MKCGTVSTWIPVDSMVIASAAVPSPLWAGEQSADANAADGGISGFPKQPAEMKMIQRGALQSKRSNLNLLEISLILSICCKTTEQQRGRCYFRR